ncbi:MAG: bifunctional UDP-N-acetylglucosamine pyrophosphorylase/glucosamine-1-phosphate N-acetyltransferase [Rickettsiales bacterium]|jgi:bifunctional UDP-N-acetylglucosamine pyrophosphorylase/glucosamine-1-phosphate N-acetyltransferase
MSSLSIIILAAGKGTRMKSSLPKVLHKIAGREMLNLAIDAAKKLNPSNICVVISKEMEKFAAEISEKHPQIDLIFSIQKQQLGTANAVEAGVSYLKEVGDQVLVLYGDTPLIKSSTLDQMIKNISEEKNAVCVLGFDCKSANKYGRLVVEKNELLKITEFKDASESVRKITLCNSGVVAIDGTKAKDFLDQIDNKNASGEYYLTDIVSIAKQNGSSCGFIQTDEKEVMGVNSRIELSLAEKIKQKEMRQILMENGVTMHNPKSVYLSFDTQIGNDVIIHPEVVFGIGVEISSNVEIKSFSHIEGAKIASGAVVGPFARIRPGTILEEDVKIGNFVEVKKSTIKQGAKINHLSYIGDAEVGKQSNIGAGTITCNYDGYTKQKTTIGENVFVGSNSALIAPVNIGNGVVVGAGSVISKDVETDDLAVCRSPQRNLNNGGKDYHQKRNK